MTRVPTQTAQEQMLYVPKWSIKNPTWLKWPANTVPRVRLIIDNDFEGDPDDLFQLVHHLLSPSVDIRAIVCSHGQIDKPKNAGTSAANAVLVAEHVMDLMGVTDTALLHRGSEKALADNQTPQMSNGVKAILDEASRHEPDRPLFFAAGAGFTDLASAYLIDPTIVDRMTVVWIGGIQHDDIVGTKGRFTAEYNRDVDLIATQIVFSAGFQIWQVPRDVYRRCILSEAELRERVWKQGGAIGKYMYEEIRHILAELSDRIGRAEMYPMGDQPLVLLTVLEGVVEEDDDFTSSKYVLKPTPQIADDGSYIERTDAKLMRVYTDLDFRLMFEDMFIKLREFTAWQDKEMESA